MITLRPDPISLQRAEQVAADKARRCAAIALTRTAVLAQKLLRDEMSSVLDRPTPFTLSGTVVRPALYRREPIAAAVVFKDWQARYMDDVVLGLRQRGLKRFELALQAAGTMPRGWVCVPAAQAPRDAFGNVPRGLIMQIISQIGTELTGGYQNRSRPVSKRVRNPDGTWRWVTQDSAASRRNKQRNGSFYAIQPGGDSKVPPGIYQRRASAHGSMTRMLFLFAPQAAYHQQIDLQRIGQEAMDRYYLREFEEALRK
ncbi:hypothetical protein N8I74_10995 [Chitiniphilus purpureus]|uniref:HK97 gp10 family phage protein n=1 Tax=Chitiniphilus purpureus TaxID=2981137 RepID=A0ABY6DHZ3_9NEIS|nr:hypothetical protein [Chitiniphilus sp. CD1]UXY13848.1 hypothetical protein N8I74_10995 [Chitiniphilus sp. CD1]